MNPHGRALGHVRGGFSVLAGRVLWWKRVGVLGGLAGLRGRDGASVVVAIKATIALRFGSREHPNDPLFQG